MQKKKYLGLLCSMWGVAFWLLLIFGLILRLPVKLPTFILLSWPVLPGIICGVIFYRMDANGSWD